PSANGLYDRTLTSGQSSANNNFGNFQPVSLSGFKFNDLNASGSFDGGEPGLSRSEEHIVGKNCRVLDKGETSTVTDDNGIDQFTGLNPGHYSLREVGQIGWTEDFPSANGFYDRTLTSGQSSANNNFGNFQSISLSGIKFNDLNASGSFDGGEPGLS